MAFRMARDLGLHLAPKKLSPLFPHFSDEDLAIRNQIFWSCYTWDKTISLCLGRTPAITNVIELPKVETLLDGYDADAEIWEPTTTQGSLLERLLKHRAFSSTRFAAYCELCVITHDVLDKLYIRTHRSDRGHLLGNYMNQTLERLDEWSSRLPLELLVGDDTQTLQCPPLHILLLNLVYQTVVILLCRPYRTSSETARARCTRAAQMTDTLFMLHVRRFGFRCVTWLQTYTMFVACTINVKDLKENRSQDNKIVDEDLARAASSRLDFGLEILRQGASSTPSAGRCASIVAQLLNNGDNTTVSSRQEGRQGEKDSQPDLQDHRRQPGVDGSNAQPLALASAIDRHTLTQGVNPPETAHGTSINGKTSRDEEELPLELLRPGEVLQLQAPKPLAMEIRCRTDPRLCVAGYNPRGLTDHLDGLPRIFGKMEVGC